MLRLMTIALSASLLTATPAVTPAPVTPAVVTVVRVPTPWYAPQWLVTRRMRGTMPQYRAIDGLLFKAYAHSADRHFGGVYFWRDSAAAEAWFTPAWFARVQKQYGEAGNVRRFTIVSGTAHLPAESDAHSDAVAVLTTTALASAAATTAQHATLPPLDLDQLAQYLVRDDTGRLGAITVWRTAHAARNADARAHQLLGSAVQGMKHERFSCPIQLPVTQITR